MKNISQQSRKRRVFLLTVYVLVPLVFLFSIVYFGLSWWRDYTIKHNGIQSIETKTEDTKTEIPNEDLNNPSKPTDTKTDDGKTGSGSTTGNNGGTKTGGTPTPSGNWWDYPSKMYPTTKSGNDLLVLVNKKYYLVSSYAPSDLVNVTTSGIRVKSGGSYYVRNILINDLKALNDQAKSQGVDLSVISAYRSYSQQVSTYNYWVSYNGGNTNAADQVSARAGHSQHQLGTAVDFSTKDIGDAIGDSFTNTKAEKWLRNNAWKYGFALAYPSGYESTTGYAHESWHFRYIGVSNATQWHTSGKILELWLREKNGV